MKDSQESNGLRGKSGKKRVDLAYSGLIAMMLSCSAGGLEFARIHQNWRMFFFGFIYPFVAELACLTIAVTIISRTTWAALIAIGLGWLLGMCLLPNF